MKKLLEQRPVVIDGHTHVGISPKFYYQYGYPYALSLEDLIIRMETLDVDHAVVFPFVDSAFYKKTPSARIGTTTRYCRFPYEIENRNLLKEIYEIFPQHSQKMLPFLMFDPSRETEKQAAHLEKLAEEFPVFGLKTVTTYIQSFVTDLENTGKPILDFARKKQLPIVFHSAVHPDDPWASVYDIVDFAERHADIRLCIAHSARFVRPVLEKAAELENCFVDFSAFIIHCKLAQQNSPAVATPDVRFPADYGDPHSAMMQMAQAYPETMLWGSDTPFYYWMQKYYLGDGTLVEDRLECGYQEEAQLLHSLPQEIKNRIAYKNVLKFIFG
ncbi:MAG: amidohydrolase family protein [Actinobacteria bacterium]|nr:amidohydrolase family protein [Actinomycetota bacterium]